MEIQIWRFQNQKEFYGSVTSQQQQLSAANWANSSSGSRKGGEVYRRKHQLHKVWREERRGKGVAN